MANVNLISTRRADRVRLTKIAKGLMGTAVVTAAIGLMAVTYQGVQIFSTNVQIDEHNKELSKLNPILDQIKVDEEARNRLQPKLVTLTEAQGRTKRWFGIMEGMKRAVPEETWLTSLAVERAGPEGGLSIRLNGVTVNQSRVGETMFRLTQQPDNFEKVDLRYTQTIKVENRENVEFELAAMLHQPKEPAKVGEENASKTN